MNVAGVIAGGLRAIGRLGDRVATRAIDYDGAGGGRRLHHAGEMPLPLAAQIGARMPLARRARYLVGSNGYAAAGVAASKIENAVHRAIAVIGSGIPVQRLPSLATNSSSAVNNAL